MVSVTLIIGSVDMSKESSHEKEPPTKGFVLSYRVLNYTPTKLFPGTLSMIQVPCVEVKNCYECDLKI
jgi:hypothetical protein